MNDTRCLVEDTGATRYVHNLDEGILNILFGSDGWFLPALDFPAISFGALDVLIEGEFYGDGTAPIRIDVECRR